MNINRNKNKNKSSDLLKEGEHLLEIELPNGTIHVVRFQMDIHGRFWWESRVTPLECSKMVDLCRCLYRCIVGVGDERQYLIPNFLAWIDVSHFSEHGMGT